MSDDLPVISGADFRADMARARWDIGFFCKRFLGFTPHPGQERLFKTVLMRTPSEWRAAYLTICVSAGNRAGKTLGLAVVILHSTMFKMGAKPPDPTNLRSVMAWNTTDYDWYHFGIQQETSELVFYEITKLLTGVHEAQKAGCPLTELLGPNVATWDKKYRGDYPWIVLHQALGGGEIHFRTTSERAVGSLGKDMHGVSWDECAFDPQFDFVVDEVLHMRRAGTGGQLILISTATEGMTAFADRWFEGDPESPDRKPSSMSLRISSRENIGYGLDEETFERLIADLPEYLIPQNVDGGFIESRSAFFGSQAVDACFVDDLPETQLPVRNHRYANGVDPALTYDSSWSIVLDYTRPKHWVGVFADRRTGRQTTLSVSHLATTSHRTYTTPSTTCTTCLDATGFGGKAFKDLLSHLHPFRAVEFGGTRSKKLRLLLDLKDAIEKGRLKLPRSGKWLILRRQLMGYRLEDRKLETDALMALACAVSEARRQPDYAGDGSFDYFGTEAPTRGVDSLPARAQRLGTISIMGNRE